jgi:hypothetical protein
VYESNGSGRVSWRGGGVVKITKPSPVVAFVKAVWDNANSGKGHSWDILNGSLSRALRLAIKSHFKFQPDDFQKVMENFRGGFWFGADPDGKGYGTGFYSLAVEHGNMSAAQSYEKWKGMAPYLFLGKRLCVAWGCNFKNSGSIVIQPAFAELATHSLAAKYKTDDQILQALDRDGKNKWWVTGFDNEVLRIASYYSDSNQGGHQTGKPKKLKKVTHAELAEMSAVIRAAIRPEKVKKPITPSAEGRGA